MKLGSSLFTEPAPFHPLIRYNSPFAF